MNELSLYLFETFCRSLLILSVLLVGEKVFRWHFTGSRRILYFLMLLMIAVPMSVWNLRPDFLPRFYWADMVRPIEVRTASWVEELAPAVQKTIPKMQEPVVVPKTIELVQKPKIPMQFSYVDLLCGLYFLGVILFLGIRFIAFLQLHRRVRLAADVTDLRLIQIFDSARLEVGLKKKKIRLLNDSGMGVGCACYGFFRRSVLLPVRGISDLGDWQIKAVLVHELEHIRNHDHTAAFFLYFFQAFHWFNPLMHYFCRHLQEVTELECDAGVARKMNLDLYGKKRYGELLLALATEVDDGMALLPAPGSSKSARELKTRIIALMKPPQRAPGRTLRIAVGLTIVLIGISIPTFGSSRLLEFDSKLTSYIPPEQISGDWKNYLGRNERLMEQGQYEEALIRLRWALERVFKNVGAFEFRITHILAQWQRLGNVYPFAVTELRRVRDVKEKYLLHGGARRKLLAHDANGRSIDWSKVNPADRKTWSIYRECLKGDMGVMHDIIRINRLLNEEMRTVVLFSLLDRSQPEFAFQNRVFVKFALLKAGDYSLFAKYFGSPETFWKNERAMLERMLKIVPVRHRQNLACTWRERIMLYTKMARYSGNTALADRMNNDADALFGFPLQETLLRCGRGDK